MASRPRLSQSSRTSSLDVPMDYSISPPRGGPVEMSGRGSSSSGRFLLPERGRMVQQKSSESQDSTASAISMLSVEDSNTHLSTASSSPTTKIDLINKKGSPLEKDNNLEASTNSSKGIWKRAFFSMKKDKTSKTQNSSKKKESKVAIVTEPPKEETGDVDPVYNLLRFAATKGTPAVPQPNKSGTSTDNSRGTSPALEAHPHYKSNSVNRTASMPNKRSNTGPINNQHQETVTANPLTQSGGNKLTRGASMSANSPPPPARVYSSNQEQGKLHHK